MTGHPNSLWLATAPSPPETSPLRDRIESDVAIVGGGITGLSAALHLGDAGKRCVVLEAHDIGWGASGRNGGQVNPGWRILPSEAAARLGHERSSGVLDMLNRAADLVFGLVRRYAIDCVPERPGLIYAGIGGHGQEFLHAWAREWGAFGVETDILDRMAVSDALGSDFYSYGLRDPRGGHVQPLSYVRGLARAAIEQGARIHTGSRAMTIERAGPDWRVATGDGHVTARHVVFCGNGYTDSLWGGLRKTIVPITSFLTATEPLAGERLRSLLPGRHAVAEARRILHYYRLDGGNRFVMGGRGNLMSLREPGSVAHLRRMALAIFPQLDGVAWEYDWGGQLALTPDQIPRLFCLDRNVHAGLGFNGRGVAMASMFGLQLCRAVMGESPDMPVESIRTIPYHRLRQIGITWYLARSRVLDAWDLRARRRDD